VVLDRPDLLILNLLSKTGKTPVFGIKHHSFL